MFDDLRRTVFIPLGLAMATGGLCGLLLLALAAWRGWPVAWAAIGSAAAALLSWLAWSARFASALEYKIAPGLPKIHTALTHEAGAQTVNLHIHKLDPDGYNEGVFLDRLPVSASSLAALANRAITGQSLTTAAMSEILDRPSWEALRDRFISAGLLTWRAGSRAHGCEVTARGVTIFRRLAAPTTPHRGERDD